MATDGHQAAAVDETAHRRFEQLWSEGEPHPIEEFLPDAAQQSYLPTLEELVLIDMEFSWRAWSSRCAGTENREAGQTSGPPQVETYVNRFAIRQSDIIRRLVLEEIQLRRRFGRLPLSIGDYRQRFPELDLPDTVIDGGVGPQAETAVVPIGGAREPSPAETLPREFGPYRLLERIGAGGMGVVYRAWQANVGRDVAVKVLRTDHLNTLPRESRQTLIDRFRNESRSTARIDHPQIVTIHDVGEVDGVPYYAMQFVAGMSLAERVRSERPGPRDAARLCRDVALAVQAAHDYGILHRDLKPHNIIVAAESGTPYVADFGLAKLLDEEASPTVTGEILGTPQYMSPEQAQDSGGVTVRADVYSLGALLYFLLTSRPPFTGRNHLDILKQVIDDEPPPPRESNPQLDADLQVICLKCLRKEPQSRYASAGALASDLSNWLEGKPIAARPTGRWERLSRWCRRNPLAAVGAVAILMGVAALAIGFASATAALKEARASDHQAREAVNDFFTIVSEDVLLNQPNMQPLRRELLERALAHYQQFLQTRQDDPEWNAEIAAAHYRVGRIKELVESSEAALPPYEHALAMQQALKQAHPGDVEIERDLSTTLNACGACLTQLSRFNEALAAFLEARVIRAGLVERIDGDDDDGIEFRRLLANTTMNIGLVHKRMRQLEPARQQIESSIAMRNESLAEMSSPSEKLIHDQALAYFNLANLEADYGYWESALEHSNKAIDLLEPIVLRRPDDLETRYRVVVCYRLNGEICSRQQRWAHAEQAYRAEQSWISRLAVENPRVVQYQVELARVLLMRGQRAFAQHEFEAAEALFLDGGQRLSSLVDDGLQTREALADLVQAWTGMASIHHEQRDWSQALKWSTRALPYAQQLAAEFPEDRHYSDQMTDLQRIIDSANAESGSPVGEPR